MAQQSDVDAIAASAHDKSLGSGQSDATDKKKQHETTLAEVDAETGEVEKSYYSKVSVWLMILYSGLAIGSDG